MRSRVGCLRRDQWLIGVPIPIRVRLLGREEPGLRFEHTHGIARQSGNRLLASSDGFGWSALYASLQTEAPFEGDFAAVPHVLVVAHLTGPVRVRLRLDGITEERVIPAGGISVLPGGADFGVRLDRPLESLHLYLPDGLFQEAAGAPAGVGSRAVRSALGLLDPLIEELARAICDALQGRSGSSDPYIAAIAKVLACRLPRVGGWGHEDFRSPGVLGPEQLDRAKSHVEINLEGGITVEGMARAAGLGHACFARAFKATTGVAPYEYVSDVRLKRARRLLSETGLPLAEVSFRCGFAHQQHMSRVVRARWGVTPLQLRRGRSTPERAPAGWIVHRI